MNIKKIIPIIILILLAFCISAQENEDVGDASFTYTYEPDTFVAPDVVGLPVGEEEGQLDCENLDGQVCRPSEICKWGQIIYVQESDELCCIRGQCLNESYVASEEYIDEGEIENLGEVEGDYATDLLQPEDYSSPLPYIAIILAVIIVLVGVLFLLFRPRKQI